MQSTPSFTIAHPLLPTPTFTIAPPVLPTPTFTIAPPVLPTPSIAMAQPIQSTPTTTPTTTTTVAQPNQPHGYKHFPILVAEEILLYTVALHKKCGIHDLESLLQYSRVMLRGDIPRVHRAVLLCLSRPVDMAKMTEKGLVKYLGMLADNGIKMTCSTSAMRKAMWFRHLATIEFWRDRGGLAMAQQLMRIIGKACARSTVKLGPDFFEPRTTSKSPPDVTQKILDACADFTTGKSKEVKLSCLAMNRDSVSVFNAAVANGTDPDESPLLTPPPQHQLAKVVLEHCTIDAERLLAFEFPDSVDSIELSSHWLKWVPTELIGSVVHWPAGLRSLTLTVVWLRERLVECMFPSDGSGSLLPPLTSLRIEDCVMQNPEAALALAKGLPPTIKYLSLRASGLKSHMLAAMVPHLPASLHTLDIGGNDLCLNSTAETKPWMLPAGLKSLSLQASRLDIGAIRALGPGLPCDLEQLDLGFCTIKSYLEKYMFPTDKFGPQMANFWRTTHAQVTEEQLLAFSSLPRGLKYLNLMGHPDTPLTDMVFRALCLWLPRDIERLAIDGFENTPRGLKTLLPKLPPKLWQLDLGATFVNIETAKSLVDHAPVTLKSLVVRQAVVAPDAKEHLDKAHDRPTPPLTQSFVRGIKYV
ncbi:hypothetical protein H9P43_005257 [Blastocladiella emersonii ATCC 22665]|nr:hypothetical protein H9P43_005257 [Blastocladiella emersonii ATCC 22665]